VLFRSRHFNSTGKPSPTGLSSLFEALFSLSEDRARTAGLMRPDRYQYVDDACALDLMCMESQDPRWMGLRTSSESTLTLHACCHGRSARRLDLSRPVCVRLGCSSVLVSAGVTRLAGVLIVASFKAEKAARFLPRLWRSIEPPSP
jgi:hypothetical protein